MIHVAAGAVQYTLPMLYLYGCCNSRCMWLVLHHILQQWYRRRYGVGATYLSVPRCCYAAFSVLKTRHLMMLVAMLNIWDSLLPQQWWSWYQKLSNRHPEAGVCQIPCSEDHREGIAGVSASHVMDVDASGVQWVKVRLTCNELSLAVQRKLTIPVRLEVEC